MNLLKAPFGFVQSFLVALILLVVGVSIEFATNGSEIIPLSFPNNLIVGIVFINLLIISYLLFKRTSFIQWICSVPAAISSIVLLAFLVLLLGFIPQTSNDLFGLTHLTTSWQFLFAQIYFLSTLGMITIKKFSVKNIPFLLNHFGLWLIVSAAMLGTGDLKRLRMELHQGKDFNYVAASADNKWYELSIGLSLIKFEMEEYPPQLAIVDRSTNKVVEKLGMVQKDLKIKRLDITILSQKSDSVLLDIHTKKIWLQKFKPLLINDKQSLVLLESQAKKFSSYLKYKDKNGKEGRFLVRVNQPVSINAWKVYQTGYDEKLGRFSQISVVELVNDPWQPVVYTGMGLLFLGSISLFWKGKKYHTK